MGNSQPLIDVALYLRGHSLDPVQVTMMLGVDGSKTRVKGEKSRTITNKEVVAKIGLWELTTRADSKSLSDQISWLRQKLSSAKCPPSAIPGVDEVEISIFVALGSDDEDAMNYESELSVEDLAWLSSIGTTVSLSFACVKD